MDWSLSAVRLRNLVRGLHPWPHAHTFHGPHRYLIHAAEALREEAHHALGFALAGAVHDESFHGRDEGLDDELPLGGGDRAALDGSPEVVRIAAVGPLVELGNDGRAMGSLVERRDESVAVEAAPDELGEERLEGPAFLLAGR